jgi:hypothetical protein
MPYNLINFLVDFMIRSKKPYAFYILVGVLGVIAMAALYYVGSVCIDGLSFETGLGILTIAVGALALRERGSERGIIHRLCILVPLGAIILFPVGQILHSGVEAFLTIGLAPLAVLTLFAVPQVALGIILVRNNEFVSGEDRPVPSSMFRMMSIFLRVREPFKKPMERLQKVGLQEGQTVLDYGCGIGSYTIPASKIVGANGTVYALDIQPMAVDRVKKRAEKNGLLNVQTIVSSIDTGLPEKSVDVVLLYDVLQMIRNREGLLQEFHRVLKPSGIVSVDCDHLRPEEVQDVFASTSLFSQVDYENGLLKFRKL